MIENIERLKQITPRELQQLYYRFFTSSEGQLILEDLKGHFWEYDTPRDMRELGQLSVLTYIKNAINPPDESLFDRPTVEENAP